MSDFADRPFVAGAVVGVRSFDVDSLGRLTGVTHSQVWRPGENVAECRCSHQESMSLAFSRLFSYTALTGDPVLKKPAKPDKPEKPAHQPGTLGCSGGFYSYFDGRNDYAKAGRVTAVVEGYGKVTVGSRGFRCEKARIVGLVRERRGSYVPNSTLFLVMATWIALTVFRALIIFDVVPLHGWPSAIVAFAQWGCLGFWVTDLIRRRRPALWFKKVSANYPDVPVYRSLKAALKAHPLTPPPTPTPDDPDFWTRDAA